MLLQTPVRSLNSISKKSGNAPTIQADRTPDLLVDASYLVALGYPRDRNHTKAKMFAEEHETGLLIPDVVLTEGIYNLRRLAGIAATVQFSSLLITQLPQFVPLTVTDFTRAV